MLIAVPLSLGIAVASGAPLIAGLISAIVGGIVAGALGGSAVQVSGPAAGLTVIVAGLVQTYGWAATCTIVAAAGVLQLLLGLFRVARAALAVSPNVIHGMLAGVGVVIALSQLHIVLGGQPHSSALDNLLELPGQLVAGHLPSAVVGGLTVAVLISWPRLPRRLRTVPAPLVAVAAGTVLAVVLDSNIARVDLPDAPLDAFAFPRLPQGDWFGILGAVGSLALVAGVESLLCAVAVDRLHRGPRANLNRELAGQGAANVVAGLLGGLPVAGVIVRSSTNVAAGARTRASAILHGVWVLLVVGVAASAIELIPLAALAAVLVFIGLQMVNVRHLRSARRHGELLAYAATACGVIGWGLFQGVLIGMAFALALTVRRLAHVTVEVQPREEGGWLVSVGGSLTLLSVPALHRALSKLPDGGEVELRLNIDYMDHSGIVAVDDWRADRERSGGVVTINELHHQWYGDAMAGRTVPARKPVPQLAFAQSWSATTAATDPARPRDARIAARRLLEDGTREFHRRLAPQVRPLLATLARTGQRPVHLFLTCADSRLVPNLITASGPGDLFTVRNVGNLVPASTTEPDSTIAAIEYAVAKLPVRTITVCGHSGCGAMAALLRPGTADDLPHLRGWLRHGQPSVERMRATAAGSRDELDLLCQANVLQQLDHLRTLPAIDDRVRRGDLELVGGYFDIAAGRMHLLTEAPTGPGTPS
ncbi:SulP family inorganic anion transporter [Rugosimonospora acidiphila]|uniref:carbonic anhydrase n=2 Tax=Rugosimonospora acidiphila TaxID=556531 RepID=A0ABP9RLN5_9ACTN